MFRYLAALILVAALAASTNKSVDARVVHPIVGPVVGPDLEAAGPSPADDDDGRRLIGTTGHDELVALCQQVAHACRHEFDLLRSIDELQCGT